MAEPSILIRNLDSDDPEAVSRAAFDLGDSRCIEAIPRLLEMFDENDPATINAVAYALGELKVQEAKPRILKYLKDPSFGGSRGTLMYALLCLDCTENYGDIVELVSDDSWEVRQKAIMILDEILPSRSRDELISGRDRLLERLAEAAIESELRSHVEDAIDDIESELLHGDGRMALGIQ